MKNSTKSSELPVLQYWGLIPELVGCKVIDIGIDDEGYSCITMKKGRKVFSVYFSMDEEQNGPGVAIVITSGEKHG